MKVLQIFLAALVLGLSLIPCCEVQMVKKDASLQISNTSSCNETCCGSVDNNPLEDKQDDCDACSPFFTCGHCSGCTTSETLVFLHTTRVDQFYFALYSSVFPNEFLINKWHPPKIA